MSRTPDAPTTTTAARRLLLVLSGAAMTAMLVSGCSSDGSDGAGGATTSGDVASSSDDLDQVQADNGVPAECRDLMAFEAADIEDVTLLPDGWPEAPIEATLCKAESNADGTTGMLSYATQAAPEEVIAAYEDALGDQVEVSDHVGQIVGQSGDVQFSVSADDGVVTVAFARS